MWKEKQERKEKGKKRVEEISQDEREKIRDEERRKTMNEMKREKHASYSSHDSCKSLSEELSDFYRGRHSSHTTHQSHRREKDRRPQEVNISLPYFHGKDNVEAYLDWKMRRVRLPTEEGARSRHRCLFEENVGKTGKVWSINFNGERFGSCFYARGRF